MKIQRVLLAPFSWLYAVAITVRHALYDSGLKKSYRLTLPTIAIGNLALGGTGKTPHVELVLRLLDQVRPIATLSRGYGRSGNELKEVKASDDPKSSGDEPIQIKQKFPQVHVFVGADRVQAIENMQKIVPALKAVVLDDAFQHRRLNAGLNILLTAWHNPWYSDALLPSGSLRDLPGRAKAAQIVMVTKCPALPSLPQQKEWRQRLRLHSDQHLFFTGIEYGQLVPLKAGPDPDQAELPDLGDQPDLLLVTGIADPKPLEDHLRKKSAKLEHVAFPDHHPFSKADLQRLAHRFDKFAPGSKLLITTEKDAVRLRPLIGSSALKDIPMAVIGMQAVVLNGPERFGALIKEYVRSDKADR